MVENSYVSTATSTTGTWNLWTASTNTTVSSTLSTGDIVWNGWANSTTSASTSTWDAWTSSTATATSTGLTATWSAWSDQPARSFRAARPRVDQVQAKQRADKLLVEHLTEEQEQSLAAHGYFDVDTIVKGEKKRFRIHNNMYQHNVFEIDQDGRKLRELCAHTSHACPQSDHALAQKLMLEHNPTEFFRVANIRDLRG